MTDVLLWCIFMVSKNKKQFNMKTLKITFDFIRLFVFFTGSLAILVMYGILMLTIF